MAKSLSDWMDFDHPIRVLEDGTVTDEGLENVHAPEVMDEVIHSDAWEYWSTGRSNQYNYRGPVLHNSEVIGSGMERDILSEPGVYVAVVADWSPTCIHCNALVSQDAQGSWVDETDGDGCDNPSGVHEGSEDNLEGWVILKLIETEANGD